MKLAVFNGSPRGKGSNTKLLLDHLLQAVTDQNEKYGWEYTLDYLMDHKSPDHLRNIFQEADYAILAFPLYTDAMPGLVKNFIEILEPLCRNDNKPKIGFIVQSGFPETIHSRYVEKYLEKLSTRLYSPYLGTVIKGGVEGIQVKPPWMTKKLYAAFYHLGKYLVINGEFDPDVVKKLAGRDRLSVASRFGFYLFSKLGFTNFYWNMLLKKNKAYEKRFARPYESGKNDR